MKFHYFYTCFCRYVLCRIIAKLPVSWNVNPQSCPIFVKRCKLHRDLVFLNSSRAPSWVRQWRHRLLRATNYPVDTALRRSTLVFLCDHRRLLRSVLLERLTCDCSKILHDRCEFSTRTGFHVTQRIWDQLLARRCGLVLQ